MTRHRDIALKIADKRAVARWRDFAASGVSPATLARLVDRGDLERVGRGLYRRARREASEHQSLIEVSRAVPHGVVCLLSALRFYELTTQLPHAVWLLIEHKARAPKSPLQRVMILRASGPSLTTGVKKHRLDGVAVPITTPAKTVADCFKYRRHVGIDVAIEALRDGLKNRAFTPDELLAMAKVDRIDRIARPYLEALL